MRQYLAAKRQHPDALLFFRLGDFYELFFDDAKTASRELQLTLTARDKERNVPMCGVPWHAAENYIARLLRQGYRVAICDQMEDPKLTKKIVRREVTRVLTPGTALDHPSPPSKTTTSRPPLRRQTAGLALLDLSTGDFRATEFTGASAMPFAIDELPGSAQRLLPLPSPSVRLKTDSREPRPHPRSKPASTTLSSLRFRHPSPRAPARQPLPRGLRPRRASRRRHRRRSRPPLRPQHAAEPKPATSTPSAYYDRDRCLTARSGHRPQP